MDGGGGGEDSNHDETNDMVVTTIPSMFQASIGRRLFKKCTRCETVYVDTLLTSCPEDGAKLIPHDERDGWMSIDSIVREVVNTCVQRVSEMNEYRAEEIIDDNDDECDDDEVNQSIGRCLDENLNISQPIVQEQKVYLDDIRQKSQLEAQLPQIIP